MKIRADLIKVSKNLHTWVGITAGIFLFICFFAGGLTMFQHDLSRWAAPPEQRLAPIKLNQYDDLVQQVRTQHPEAFAQGFELNFASKELFNAPIQWEPVHVDEAHDDHHEIDIAQGRMLATLDEQGQLLVAQENVSKVGWLIEQLHETAGVPGMLGHHTLGVYIMGIVSVLYFLAIMSGLIVLLPTLVKDFFAIRKGKNKKRFWLDTHNVVGIVSLPFHIIIAVTVIVFAFHDLLYGAMGTLAKQAPFDRTRAEVSLVADPQLNIAQLYQKLSQTAPEYQIIGMRMNNLDTPQKANVSAALYSPDQMLRGDNFAIVNFNPYQSTPIDTAMLTSESGALDKLINSMFALHFGNFGGDPTRWMYFILGIGGAFLFYSGNILWVETRLKKQKNPNLPQPQQRKDVMFMANLTIGTCLGCVLAVFASLLFLRWAYVINPELLSINHLMMYSYYVLFVLSVVYAFVVGAAKALPQFFLILALVLFAIPVTSMIAVLIPQLGLWHAGVDLIWIDVFAVIFALAFCRFYQQARSRAQVAPEGSIWSPIKLKQIPSES